MQVKDTELKRKQDRALYLCYKRCRGEFVFASEREAIDYARQQPAPQYYISARTASLLIGKLSHGEDLGNLHPMSYMRIMALYERYCFYRSHNPKSNLSREVVLETLVEEEAPHFYLSLERARTIIFRERRIEKEKIRLYGRNHMKR